MAANKSSCASPDHEKSSLSKNQLKKLKRDEKWEAGREARKEKRKARIKAKKERNRAARTDQAHSDAVDGPKNLDDVANKKVEPKGLRPVQLPVTFIIDCGFDNLMNDKERKSLASQITRCYSDNHGSSHRAHMGVSSFHGLLKERFDGPLGGQYQSWKGVRFLKDDFLGASEQAKGWTRGDEGGTLAGVFEKSKDGPRKAEGGQAGAEVVYLTSDSPDTLSELQPHGIYILGGLVDRNRHKGVCYKAAVDKGVRTAKLPIGEYMQMNSRFVLTVNQVSEILLLWLELGDWGQAFLKAIPKRKGGMLKETSGVQVHSALSEQHHGPIEKKILDAADSGGGVSDVSNEK